jgi:hypothetical protein
MNRLYDEGSRIRVGGSRMNVERLRLIFVRSRLRDWRLRVVWYQ